MHQTLRSAQLRWDADHRCPKQDGVISLGESAKAATKHPESYSKYLRQQHTRVAAQLLYCGSAGFPLSGGCADPCGMAPTDQQFRARLTAIHRLGKSPIITLRHGSPVGHFFDVPDQSEVEAAWRESRNTESERDRPAVAATVDEFPLRGLPTILGWFAGGSVPLAEARIVDALQGRIRQLLALSPTEA